MIVNLNVMCKVQLNELGKVIWLSQVDNLSDEIKQSNPELVSSIRNKIDENNCIELELWGIMSVFGQYLSAVGGPFTGTTIELNKNPNFGNYS